jgi:hypothetical protein
MPDDRYPLDLDQIGNGTHPPISHFSQEGEPRPKRKPQYDRDSEIKR